MRIFFSKHALKQEIMMNYKRIDLMVQQFVRPRSNKSQLIRYCLKDQNLVYKSLIIQGKHALDPQNSDMIKKMMALVKQ